MGMDLAPLEPIEGFHANWSGWSLLTGLLDQLGCDTGELSGSNDGDLVGAESAAQFGKALLGALDVIYIATITSADVSILDKQFAVVGRGDTVAELSGHTGVDLFALRDEPRLYEFVAAFGHFCGASGGFRQF
jgi:hypothetical protein